MKKIAFLGGGKVGQAMAAHVLENKSAEIAFIYDPFQKEDTLLGVPVIRELSEACFEGLDLVVECATADVVKANAALVLKHASFLPFSMTAFREDEVLEGAKKAAAESGHTLYLPHGAILGLDGVFDGRTIIDEVSIETIKNPKSLGRDDKEYTVVFDGTAREATGLYPRNVNVHAALSLAGIGFDRTHSRRARDPREGRGHRLDHPCDRICSGRSFRQVCSLLRMRQPGPHPGKRECKLRIINSYHILFSARTVRPGREHR